MSHPSPLMKAQAAREIIRRDELRKSRRLTALIVAIVVVSVLLVWFGYHPERASSQSASFAPLIATSYNHVAECRQSLRGYRSDDDVHALGVRTFAKYFVGFGAYWHGSDGSAYVIARLMYSFGWIDWQGHCTNGDFGPDSIR